MTHRRGFAPLLMLVGIALIGIGVFAYLKTAQIPSVGTQTSTAQTADWKIHTNSQRNSCVSIRTKESGYVLIANYGNNYSIRYPADAVFTNTLSDTPCGPTGMGDSTRFSETVTIGNRQFTSAGYRSRYSSESHVSVDFHKGVGVIYGTTDGLDTELEYKHALDSAKAIVSTLVAVGG